MTVYCKICNQQFKKLITSTHLKKHNMHTKDYIEKFGKQSLTSEEYRTERANAVSGENNPNYGNKMSDDSKNLISQNKKGKRPWNHGLKIEDTTIQKQAALKREEKYSSGQLTRHVTNMTDEIKIKISKSVKEYAAKNPKEIKNRAELSVKTKINNGYYDEKRKKTEKNFIEKCNNLGFTVESTYEKIVSLKCNKCSTAHSRSISSAIHLNMCPFCSHVGISSYEIELYNELKKFINVEIKTSDKTVLDNLELDIYIPEYKFAIEINGLYWHSEKCGKNKFYHKFKSDKCKEKDIQLIHIFEDEWLHKKEICIQRIKSKLNLETNKTYARNYKIKIISNLEAKEFLIKHHIQGAGVAANYCYALVDEYEVIYAVMTFSRLNVSKGLKHKNRCYELNRYASNGNIVGGASKLFTYFIKNVDVDEIISYSDLRWNTGKLYEKLGFTFDGNTLPGYWYTKGIERFHRFKMRKLQHEPDNKTERELREEQGYSRIWDCGHSRWKWKKI